MTYPQRSQLFDHQKLKGYSREDQAFCLFIERMVNSFFPLGLRISHHFAELASAQGMTNHEPFPFVFRRIEARMPAKERQEASKSASPGLINKYVEQIVAEEGGMKRVVRRYSLPSRNSREFLKEWVRIFFIAKFW
ncbi:MAG: hypothetical protein D6820_11025, partial [Lentisphaerae bacterium]